MRASVQDILFVSVDLRLMRDVDANINLVVGITIPGGVVV